MLRKLLALLFAIVSFVFNATIGQLNCTHKEDAYFLMFETLARDDEKFIAVDLSGALLKDTSKLVEMMQAYCDERDIEFMLDNYKGLNEKGLIKVNDDPISMIGSYIVDGMLIEFDDICLTWNTLVTETGSASAGAGYRTTIQRIHGTWTITDRQMIWIV